MANIKSHRIIIHDTTLRDGEQMAGVAFGFEEKIRLAQKMADFGVGLIDIMPVVSKTEFLVTQKLTGMFGDRISATCRSKKEDVDTAVAAGAKRVTLFSPLSDLHITEKLGITREENIKRATGIIDYAKSLGLIVDFAGEDATRADLGYLKEFLEAIGGKVATFFIADTVGCLTPESTGKLVWFVKNNFGAKIGLHFHNDFGMACANTLSGLSAGAEIFSGTFTGIGERAGNAPIEEVCTALRCLYGIDIGVKHHMLKEICDAVQGYSHVKIQKHKPIIGENAFSHESGIHVDGVLKNPHTYESFDPRSVGQERKICIGKHSGRKAIEHVLRGIVPSAEVGPGHLEMILNEIKAAAEGGKAVFSEEEILRIVSRINKRRMDVLV